MYKRIPGNDEYKLSLDGKFLNMNDEECTPLVQNGFLNIRMYEKDYLIDSTWLSLLAHFETELPECFKERLGDIYFQDTQKELTRSPSGKVMRFKKPMVIDRKYRVVPGFTRFAVSRDGEVLDLRTWRITKIYKPGNDKNYPSITIYNPDKGIHHSVYIHRLVALAWVANCCFITKPVVNHKDGNKNNFRSSNLEWVSYSDNSKHAVSSGLRPDAVKCKIRNVHTCEVREFQSFSSACVYMGINDRTKISAVMYQKKHKLVKETFEVKLADDTSPWFYEKYVLGEVSGRYTLLLTYEDGRVEEYPDVRTFKKKFKIWNTSNITELISKFKSVYPNIEVSLIDGFKMGAVQAYELKTGEIFEADGIRQMTRLIGLSYIVIRSALKNEGTKVTKGYAFRYKSDKPWDKNFTYHENNAWCVTAIHRKTGETKKFESLRKAAKFFERDRSFIKKCLDKEWLYGNWKIKAEKLESAASNRNIGRKPL